MLSRVVWYQALIIGAAEYAFLRPWEDLRQVGRRFAGELALIVISARPLETLVSYTITLIMRAFSHSMSKGLSWEERVNGVQLLTLPSHDGKIKGLR